MTISCQNGQQLKMVKNCQMIQNGRNYLTGSKYSTLALSKFESHLNCQNSQKFFLTIDTAICDQ